MFLDENVTVDRRKIITHSAFYHYFTVAMHAADPLLDRWWRSLRDHTRTCVQVHRNVWAAIAATAEAAAAAAGR